MTNRGEAMTTRAVSDNGSAAAASPGRAARAMLGAVVFAGASMLAAPSFAFPADSCIIARGGNSCTANEGGAITADPVACASLSVAEKAANTNGCSTPATPSCTAGSTVPIKLLVGLAQDKTDRYDIGLYVSTDNNKPLNSLAPTGAATCAVTAILIPPGTAVDPNTCGDQPAKTSIGNLIPLSTSIMCVAGGGGLLAIQIGASYLQSVGTVTSCSYPGTTQVFPGTPSKCNINSITVPILVVTPPESVQLVKHLVPTSDPGRFNLAVDAVTAANQTEGGSVTKSGIAGGATVQLAETAGTGTSLANYTSSFACVRTDNQASVPVNGSNQITMPNPAAGIVCTVTNTRKQATVTVNKALSPSSDAGLFDLQVNGVTVASGVGNGGTGNTSVGVGSAVTVGELAGTGTSLGSYTTSLLCTGASASGTNPGSFTMPDAAVDCTFTNTRIVIPPPPPAPATIPTLSEWMYLLLGFLLMATAWTAFRRRR